MVNATRTTESTARKTAAKQARHENAEKGFTASPSLVADLQRVLTDLVELQLQGKQAHWNVVGKNFRDLHLQLDEIVASAREFGDVIAERMRALHATADGRSSTVSSSTSLMPYPAGEVDTAATIDLITARLDAAVATLRDVHDEVDDEDPTTADILHEIIAALEQHSWMVSAENRTPSA